MCTLESLDTNFVKIGNVVFALEELDEILDAGISHSALLGHEAENHNGDFLPIVSYRGRIALRDVIECDHCHKRHMIIYRVSGLHEGAWCYSYSETGHFFNLRDQVFVCDACADVYRKRLNAIKHSSDTVEMMIQDE